MPPTQVTFESRIMQGKRPDKLWRAAELCMASGYRALGPVASNHVCISLGGEAGRRRR